jgi:predicted outer membrane repeat protein
MTTLNAANFTELRTRITTLNSDPNGPHTINLTGTNPNYVVNNADPAGGLFGPSAFPVIIRDITIDAGVTPKTIARAAGAPGFRMFAVNAKTSGSPTAKLTLKNVILLNAGGTNIGGAAIVNDAPVRLENCTIQNTNGGGCAIYNGDGYRLDAINTTFINNSSNADGGAIYSSSTSQLFVTGCAFVENTAQRGAAIFYASNGGSTIIDSSFLRNTTQNVSSFDVHKVTGATVDARYNWWGAGPGPNSGVVGAETVSTSGVTFAPWRTAPLSVGASIPHALPKDLGLKLGIATSGAQIRFGPSANNPYLAGAAPTFTAVTLNTSANNQYPVLAKATDETGLVWYGYVHPNRPGLLSWSVRDSAGTTYTSVIPAGGEVNLPDFSIPGTMAVEPAWGTSSLAFTKEPFPLRTTGAAFRGFGIFNNTDYGTIPGCRHPGVDFFPSAGDVAGVRVGALADGIVVGIGRDFETTNFNPAAWGATKANALAANAGKFNFVIRTGGHFVLYGHLESVEQWFYVGARVRAGDVIGTLIQQTGNTHLHLEVRSFTSTQLSLSPRPVLTSFGAINRASTEKPDRAVDPLAFVANKPSTPSSSVPNAGGTCGSTPISYTADTYTNIPLGAAAFSMVVNQSTYQQCISIVTNTTAVVPASNCTTATPPP